ncbi:SDR family oxidoreductase [Streptomyces sp. GbtcB7]|uniref:SDR family oxidoreductase n=1 Tax=Streptomyces sp. GbtcB7 TaxID=2824752 RepID=UPI001C304B53|nr:SDR family oxidoreductase [Streptomyces sp. GbtcB7]
MPAPARSSAAISSAVSRIAVPSPSGTAPRTSGPATGSTPPHPHIWFPSRCPVPPAAGGRTRVTDHPAYRRPGDKGSDKPLNHEAGRDVARSTGPVPSPSPSPFAKPVRQVCSGLGSYAATKAAIRSPARTWAAEPAGRGIRVNALPPGPVRPSQPRAATGCGPPSRKAVRPPPRRPRSAAPTPLGRAGRPGEVAAAARCPAGDQGSLGAVLFCSSRWLG